MHGAIAIAYYRPYETLILYQRSINKSCFSYTLYNLVLLVHTKCDLGTPQNPLGFKMPFKIDHMDPELELELLGSLSSSKSVVDPIGEPEPTQNPRLHLERFRTDFGTL